MHTPDSTAALIDRRLFLSTTARLAALGASALSGLPSGLAALAAPENMLSRVTQARSFNLLVLGDSIMWGQGLNDEAKFSRLVQQWLEQRLGRAVRRDVFAHSGARLSRDPAGDAAQPRPGEVPDWYPSIPHQIELANSWLAGHALTDAEHAAPLRPENIHLVLIDGGINDVRVANVITVDPTISDPAAWVRKLTHERCAPQVRPLLERVLVTYPNAKVVVTGYYPVVSDLTDIGELGKLLGMFGLLGELLDSAVDGALRARLGSQSRAFHETYVSEVREVVNSLASTVPAASIAMSGKTERLAPGSRVTMPPLRRPPPRCTFVDVGFQPEHSFGAPSTMLYGVNAHDPPAAARMTQCQQAGQGANPKCYWASAGHPNPAGAKRYADAIERALEPFLPEWGGAAVAAPTGAVRP